MIPFLVASLELLHYRGLLLFDAQEVINWAYVAVAFLAMVFVSLAR